MFRANLIFPYTGEIYSITYSFDNPTQKVIINRIRRRTEGKDTY
jgi:hypothetical protein